MSAIDAPLAAGPTRPNAIRRAYSVLRIPGTIALSVIAAICITALLAPWIAPYDPEAVDLANVFAGPSGTHLLGTDALGRDLLSRLIWGARPTLQGPIIVVLASTLIGVTIGIVSAWTRGVVDATASRALDVLFAVPGIIFALVAVALFGVGLTAAVIGLTIAYVPYVARVCRGAALREASLPYIEACSVQGYSGLRICARHILPNLRPLIVAQAAAAFGFVVVDLAAISFLGLGVQPPRSDWGVSVAVGLQSSLEGHPAEALYAGALIVILVAAFKILGDQLGAPTRRGRT